MSEQQVYAASGGQILRLAVRLETIGLRLAELRQAAAVRALAEGPNAERAAWLTFEGQLAGLAELAGVRGQGSGVRGQESGGRGPGGDAPAGPAEPTEPLGGAVVIEIPASACDRADKALWWSQERQRMDEAFLFERGAAIQAALIRPGGLLEQLKGQLVDAFVRLGVEVA